MPLSVGCPSLSATKGEKPMRTHYCVSCGYKKDEPSQYNELCVTVCRDCQEMLTEQGVIVFWDGMEVLFETLNPTPLDEGLEEDE